MREMLALTLSQKYSKLFPFLFSVLNERYEPAPPPKASTSDDTLFARPAESTAELRKLFNAELERLARVDEISAEAVGELVWCVVFAIEFCTGTRRVEPELTANYHPIETAWDLLRHGCRDVRKLRLALLHDIIEDGIVPKDIVPKLRQKAEAELQASGKESSEQAVWNFLQNQGPNAADDPKSINWEKLKMWKLPKEFAFAALIERDIKPETCEEIWTMSHKRGGERLEETPEGEAMYYAEIADLEVKVIDRMTSLKAFLRTTYHSCERERAQDKIQQTRKYLLPAIQAVRQKAPLYRNFDVAAYWQELHDELENLCDLLEEKVREVETMTPAREEIAEAYATTN